MGWGISVRGPKGGHHASETPSRRSETRDLILICGTSSKNNAKSKQYENVVLISYRRQAGIALTYNMSQKSQLHWNSSSRQPHATCSFVVLFIAAFRFRRCGSPSPQKPVKLPTAAACSAAAAAAACTLLLLLPPPRTPLRRLSPNHCTRPQPLDRCHFYGTERQKNAALL
jgi:hypothetical protein